MVLVYVLSGVTAMMIIAVSLLSDGNFSYRLAHNALDAAQGEAIAEAAINRAVLGLSDTRPERRWRVDGVAQRFNFDGTELSVAVHDELGKIDINHADASSLIRLFQSAGLDWKAASELADKVLDWREEGDTRRLNGANARDYRDVGSKYRPRDGKFQSVDELKLVVGMTEELFHRIEPALTVYSGRQRIDPKFAPREALLALPNMDGIKVSRILSHRVAEENGIVLSTVSLGGRAFSVTIEFRGQQSITREAIIRLTEDPNGPYWLLNWK
jgi:general secretion pathway protein K